MDRLRPPSCYVKFDVTRCATSSDYRTLSAFPASAAPLRVQAYPTQYNTIRFKRFACVLDLFFSYLPVSVFVLGSRCTLVLFAESPVQHDRCDYANNS